MKSTEFINEGIGQMFNEPRTGDRMVDTLDHQIFELAKTANLPVTDIKSYGYGKTRLFGELMVYFKGNHFLKPPTNATWKNLNTFSYTNNPIMYSKFFDSKFTASIDKFLEDLSSLPEVAKIENVAWHGGANFSVRIGIKLRPRRSPK